MDTYIEVTGKQYPMRFSIGAAKILSERYGGLENIGTAISGGSGMGMFDTVLSILEILIMQGCAYKNAFENGLPVPEGAAIIDGEWIPLSAEKLEVGMGLMELAEAKDKIFEAMNAGSKRSGPEIKDKKGKNEQTT